MIDERVPEPLEHVGDETLTFVDTLAKGRDHLLAQEVLQPAGDGSIGDRFTDIPVRQSSAAGDQRRMGAIEFRIFRSAYGVTSVTRWTAGWTGTVAG